MSDKDINTQNENKEVVENKPEKQELKITNKGATKPKRKRTKKIAIATTLTTLAMGGIAVGTILALQGNGKITVKYTANGKEEVLEIDKDTKISDIQPNAVPGYIFDGWFKDPSLTIPYTDDDVLQNESILYPKFVAREYVVTYYSNDNSNKFKEQKVYFDTDFSLLENTFERSHFTFVGWSTNPNAKYTDHKLLFENTALTLDTEGLNLYAVWKGEQTTVSFISNDMKVDGVDYPVDTEGVFYGDTFTLPAVTGNIYNTTDTSMKFAGFAISFDGGSTVTYYQPGDTFKVLGTEILITPYWSEESQITVVFNVGTPEGETIADVDPIQMTTGESATLPNIESLTNYNFLGWNTQANGKGTTYQAGDTFVTDENVILYAIFEGKERIVEIYDDETLVETITTKYGEKITLQSHSKDGFDFLGYNTNKDFSGVSYKGDVFVNFSEETTKLYVFWKTKEVKVYFNVNGGVGYVDTLTIENNTTFSFSATQIEHQKQALNRKYYTLVGWSLDQEATPETEGVGFNVSVVNTPRTYFAVWQRNKVSVTYTTEAGDIVPLNTQVDQGSEFVLTDSGFEREGYYVKEFIYNGTTYQIGDSISLMDEEVFLVEIQPVWQEAYHLNFIGGGTITTVILTNQTTKNVADLTLGDVVYSPDAPNREIVENSITKYFVGWSKTKGATEPDFVAGDFSTSITVTDDLIFFYAVYQEADTECFTFTELNDGTYSVSRGASVSAQTILVVPSTYNGKNVTTVSSFKKVKDTHIILPSTITTIADYAFEYTTTSSISMMDNVKTIGNGAFQESTNLTSIKISANLISLGTGVFKNCSSLTSINIPAGVTSIRGAAFSDCSSLETVTFAEGSTCTDIESHAFYSCSSLTAINIPDGVKDIGGYAFYCCSKLENINIPESVTSFGWYAFYDCKNLAEITISENVTSFGTMAFGGCSNLTVNLNTSGYSFSDVDPNSPFNGAIKTINIGANVTNIPSYLFYYSHVKTVTFAEGSVCTTIESNAFVNCSKLTSINIPASVETVCEGAFSGCSSLETVTFAEGSACTSIGSSAFANCSKLTSINIPNGVNDIGGYVFQYCSSLTNIKIPESVTKIGWYTFQFCKNLTEITIPASVTSIGSYSFNACSSLETVTFDEGSVCRIVGESAFYECISLASIKIPNSVTSIGNYAFYKCTGLTGINIPNSVTTIGSYSFNACSSLETVTFAEGSVCKTIANYAFGYTKLTSINIPDSVKTIGGHSFEGCTSLQTITIGEGVTTIGGYTFTHPTLTSITFESATPPTSLGNNWITTDVTIYVPTGSKSDYETAFASAAMTYGITITIEEY